MPEASPPPPIQFATVERLIAFLGEPEAIALSNPENPTGTEPNLTTLDEALRYAHGEALPYVSRFDIPTDRVPLLVEQAVCRIARRFLDRIRPRDFVTKEYDRAIEQLKAFAAGRLLLVFANGEPVPLKTQTSTAGSTGSASTLIGFNTPRSRFAGKVVGFGNYDGEHHDFDRPTD